MQASPIPRLPLQPRAFVHLQQTNTLTEHESARTLCTEVKADGSKIASLHRRLSFRSYTGTVFVICDYSIPRGNVFMYQTDEWVTLVELVLAR